MDDQKHILFVDDEPRILSGLRRTLRSVPENWSLSFVDSGEKALETMREHPVQVVVSDLRMPGMSGSELLEHVRHEFPQTARIALSGQSDEELPLKAIGPIQNYLKKPCSWEEIQEAVQRAVVLQDVIFHPEIIALVEKIEIQPKLPSVYHTFLEEAGKEDATVDTIANKLCLSPHIETHILRCACSSYFSAEEEIVSLREAVNTLGLETFRTLLLTLPFFFEDSEERKERNVSLEKLEHLWRHSTEVAIYARQIAHVEHWGREQAHRAFAAGLLHDIGMLPLWENSLEEDYKDAHDRLGAHYLFRWGLPQSVVEAAAFHHYPGQLQVVCPGPLAAVHAANVFSSSSILNDTARIDRSYMQGLKMEEHLSHWEVLCEVTDTAEFGKFEIVQSS